ncbi:hypothetical protein ACQUJS_05945 [Ralstonia pseudosolanacearum]|uniref:Uncharacterized protein n=1 Tax=Ralstonia solanacearum TaxID=305 RepID=A0A0S4TXF8_RALSL|nr:protein of unknown function [Ralstonia solanacearum]
MDLAATVAEEIGNLRAMNVTDIRSLPEASHREIESSWARRRSVSVYIERDDDGVRVIVKAFESRFPHISTRAIADGFRLSKDGQLAELSEADKSTLY